MGEARPSLRLSTLWQRAMRDSSLTAMTRAFAAMELVGASIGGCARPVNPRTSTDPGRKRTRPETEQNGTSALGPSCRFGVGCDARDLSGGG